MRQSRAFDALASGLRRVGERKGVIRAQAKFPHLNSTASP